MIVDILAIEGEPQIVGAENVVRSSNDAFDEIVDRWMNVVRRRGGA